MSTTAIITVMGQDLEFEFGRTYDFVVRIGRERTIRGKFVAKGEGRARHELTIEDAKGALVKLSERDLINLVGPLPKSKD
jgi:hypothetical protein